tara:strand:- start:209 stop:352 length:144 start_codon:yes stop_codon:yes gene_type:complete
LSEACKPYFLKTMNENAELLNGRVAMLGIIAAIGAYCLTGDIIPGIF